MWRSGWCEENGTCSGGGGSKRRWHFERMSKGLTVVVGVDGVSRVCIFFRQYHLFFVFVL